MKTYSIIGGYTIRVRMLRIWLTVLAAVGAVLFQQYAVARDRVLDRIDTRPGTEQSEIRISFAVPMQLVSQSAPSTSDNILVRLRRVNPAIELDQGADNIESLSWRPTSTIPLTVVEYEDDAPGGPVLNIRFRRSVKYELVAGSDFRSLVIRLFHEAAAPATDSTPISRNDVVPSPARALPPPSTAPPAGTPSGAAQPVISPVKGDIVINLESISNQSVIKSPPPLPGLEQYQLYTTQVTINGVVWQRLRLGFFSSSDDAKRVMARLTERYPDAWLAKASIDEIAAATGRTPEVAVPVRQSARKASVASPASASPPTSGTADEKRIQSFMQQAEQSILDKDYSTAIRLYTKVLTYPENSYTKRAQEFLGLARERNGQVAHAIAEYKKFLELYPEGEDANRVKQRLIGLTTARQAPKGTLQDANARAADDRGAEWEIFGGFSQFYRRDVTNPDSGDSIVTQSSLSTDLDLAGRLREKDYSLSTRFTGGYQHDFLDLGQGSKTRVIYLYADADLTDKDIAFRAGRQTRSNSGVLGRYDGAQLSYKFNPSMKFNFIAGYPVLSTEDSVNDDKDFYSLSLDLGTYANAWDFNVFYIEQDVDNILDRRAIGGEARYFKPEYNMLGLVDYDISYDELNILLFIANWILPDSTTINTSIDYRKSPLLSTTNALQGQIGVESISDLQSLFTESEIRQLAQDRTATSKAFTLGASRPIKDTNFQVSGDVTFTQVSGTPASGTVAATPATGTDFFINTQLIGSNLFKQGDISILGLRYGDTSTSKTTSFIINTRYPITQDWRINPRVRLDYRDNTRDGSTQWIFAPFIRSEYRWQRKYRFEAELGGEWSNLRLTDSTDRSSSYYFSLGYRIDF